MPRGGVLLFSEISALPESGSPKSATTDQWVTDQSDPPKGRFPALPAAIAEQIKRTIDSIDADTWRASDYREREHPTRALYVFGCAEFVKVGVSKHPHRRLADLAIGSPFEVTMLMYRTVPGAYAPIAERACHGVLAPYLHRNEWFRVDAGHAKAVVQAAFVAAHCVYRRHKRRIANGELDDV